MATFVDKVAIGADEARDHFGDILGRTTHGKERIVISRHRKPVAALVPIEDLELLERIEDEGDIAEIRARLAAPAGEPIPLEAAAERLGVKL